MLNTISCVFISFLYFRRFSRYFSLSRYVTPHVLASALLLILACMACGGAVILHLMPNTQKGSTALIVAAERGHTECARLLVEGGADKDAKNNVRVLDLARFLYMYVCIVY